jgi:phosphomannomutase
LTHTIKFGTDGWRAIIAQEYTVENVARIAYATAKWMNAKFENPSIVIGHDCRFGGELFMETAMQVFLHEGLKVNCQYGITSTPMLSLATKKYNCNLGIILTASHNPPSYNGYKVKAHFGGPLQPEFIQEIEDIIPENCPFDYTKVSIEEAKATGKITILPLEQDYINHILANFDIDAIKNSGLKLAYDAMYGAGQNVMKKIFPEMSFLHCDYNPSFMGQAPEPIAKNLKELEAFLQANSQIDSALVTDGDADRIGLYNGKGEFIDSHHIILLLIHYLAKYKGMSGKVVTAFSCTPRIEKMALHYGFEHQTTKIGFKDIAKIMVVEDVLLGGEESGGIAVKGHLPERDGIWMGLIVWEFMAKSGKSLDELIQEVYEIVGEFKFERSDLHITDELKTKIIANCKAGNYTSFGNYSVKELKTIDGFKYFLDDERWVMIRPSGTEPVLRTYAEAPTLEEVRKILKATEETICR